MKLLDQVEELISKGELIEAERLLLEAPVSNTDDQIRQKILLGDVYYEQNRWSESIALFEDVLPHVEKEQLLYALYPLVISNRYLNKPKDAILYGESYLSLAKEMDIKENDIVIVFMHSNIAKSYADLGDLEKAELNMAGMKAGCDTALVWLQYYTCYAYIVSGSDVHRSIEYCLDGLRLSDVGNLLEGTDSILMRLVHCCHMVGAIKLTRIIIDVLQEHYYQLIGDAIDEVRQKYVSRFSLGSLPCFRKKCVYEKDILSELRRLELIQ